MASAAAAGAVVSSGRIDEEPEMVSGGTAPEGRWRETGREREKGRGETEILEAALAPPDEIGRAHV